MVERTEMPTREELLEAADALEDEVAEARENGEPAMRVRRVAKWLREQADEISDVTVGGGADG